MNKIFFCKIDELNDKGYKIKFLKELKDEIIGFIDQESKEIKIFSSICPHFGGEIYFSKSDNSLKCKWHGWKFCKNTGKCLTFPIKGSLSSYNFKIKPNNLNQYKNVIKNDQIYIIY